ncbi:hypothetical protein EYF80_051069 [Liparis tanakae]|uniref:Uncharacterized protein n=1 Tax=Liparis tanakae TaxID=230148 RepID=A0A4Z2FC49_9TELE|nr:hypothetical protein EYF80_051069 [Liparis tanakae]
MIGTNGCGDIIALPGGCGDVIALPGGCGDVIALPAQKMRSCWTGDMMLRCVVKRSTKAPGYTTNTKMPKPLTRTCSLRRRDGEEMEKRWRRDAEDRLKAVVCHRTWKGDSMRPRLDSHDSYRTRWLDDN